MVNSGTGEKPPYTYTGKERDASGLMYYGARYYDPALARFITPDTVSDAGTQGLNRYSYALNHPLKYNDPSGHGVVDAFLYGGWGQRVADSIQGGAQWAKSFNSSLIDDDPGVGMTARVAAYNSGIDLAAGLLSRFFSLGTGTGDWIADPTDYNKIPVLGPVGQNFGTSVGEFIMEPSVETGARFVAASCQVIGTAFGTAQQARMIGIPGTKGNPIAPAMTTTEGSTQFAGGTSPWIEDLSNVTGKAANARNKAIQSIIQEDFPDLKLTHTPRYSPFATQGVAQKGVGTQFGKNVFASRDRLRTVTIHEELHHRWWKRGIDTYHHSPDTYIPNERFYEVISRYKQMRGWE